MNCRYFTQTLSHFIHFSNVSISFYFLWFSFCFNRCNAHAFFSYSVKWKWLPMTMLQIITINFFAIKQDWKGKELPAAEICVVRKRPSVGDRNDRQALFSQSTLAQCLTAAAAYKSTSPPCKPRSWKRSNNSCKWQWKASFFFFSGMRR